MSLVLLDCIFFFFFFNDTATTEIYTLSLHDALPISKKSMSTSLQGGSFGNPTPTPPPTARSEEHTSELQSQSNLVCRLLLEKKKNNNRNHDYIHDHACAAHQIHCQTSWSSTARSFYN